MYNDDYLQHWGIKGMRWGVRRWQNEDGSLTPAGEKRYLKYQGMLDRRAEEGPMKVEKRVAEIAAKMGQKGLEVGMNTGHDLPGVILATLGTTGGLVLGTPIALLEKAYDSHKYRKAKNFVEKYADVSVDEL